MATSFQSYIDPNDGIRKTREVTIPDPDPRIITSEDINIERDRRIYSTMAVSLSSGKSFYVDMGNGGRENIGDIGAAALAKSAIGSNTTVSFRDADNQDWDLTNADCLELGLQVMAQVEGIHVNARVLKAMDPIPLDYASNTAYWS